MATPGVLQLKYLIEDKVKYTTLTSEDKVEGKHFLISLVWYLYYQEACYLRLTALRYLLVTLAHYLVFTATARPMTNTCRY